MTTDNTIDSETIGIADDLTPWVKRINAAVGYTGPNDHEDVRSILKKFAAQEANKARIDELEHVSDHGEGVWLNFDPEINPITREERIAQLTAELR